MAGLKKVSPFLADLTASSSSRVDDCFRTYPEAPILSAWSTYSSLECIEKKDDAKAGGVLPGFRRHFQTVEAGKADVEEHHVGVRLLDAFEGFVPLSGLTHDPDVFRFLEKGLDARSHQLVVVN